MSKVFFSTIFLFSLLIQENVCSQKIITVQTKNTALVLQVDKGDHLKIMYFGEKLSQESEYSKIASQRILNEQGSTGNNSAYSAAGTNTMFEPAIAVVHTDGDNSLDLQYQQSSFTKNADGSELTTILLKDPQYNFFVKL